MEYRRLGSAGVKVSAIGLGGWLTFGNAVGEETGRDVLARAFDGGINFLDTANVYARGACEEMWGRLLVGRTRSDYVLATKVFFAMGDGPNDKGLSRKHIMEQCHASLRRLKTDYVDVYQCHRFDEETPLEETVRAMDDLIRQGKALYWGFSLWPAAEIKRAIALCDARGYTRPVSSQPPYNVIDRQVEPDVIPLCIEQGIGQVEFCPLAQGLLTGKYLPGQPPPADSRAADDRQNAFIAKRLVDDGLLRRIQSLRPIAEELGCTMAQLSLAWILHRPGISSAIIGASKASQVTDNLRAVDVALTPDHMARIDAAIGG